MNINLEKLVEEARRLAKFNDLQSMMKLDDLYTQFECKSFDMYATILDIARKNGATRVFDIGCASGYQSEVFLQAGMDYVGIEGYFTDCDFWNSDVFEYICKPYPFKINTRKGDVAISKLCIGWNCFRYENDSYNKQVEALARDFNTVILYTTEEFITLAKNYFNVKRIEENLYLLKNNQKKEELWKH